ncbi:ThuA domain-containing protein [Halalkalibacter sp. APA_J-10(15)]|uniref:ThuA domain-containing protein n=1 Tax=unclassified Halalkalibacter TaxID=2893063 RepID=UPI001FF63BC1|nr:ThuA domain-containing protein [Halalkalibacter sp. APA_J-10(15)]MCK0473123.1 ThuA domain-containing protein [Halalkalibacter sp. APA_J-10(15)]
MSKKIFAYLGDYYHELDLMKESLSLVMKQLKVETDVTFVIRSVDTLIEDLKMEPDVVILSKENRLNPEDGKVIYWMDDEVAKSIASYAEGGGSWFAWHSGLASYDNIDTYIKMLRGYFTYHPPQANVTYEPVSHHPFTKGLASYEVWDEHYFVSFVENDTTVFLRSVSDDGEAVAGWHHRYGKGRVACFTPSHCREALLHPYMQQMMKNIIVWCLGENG